MYCKCLFEENNDACRIFPPGRHKILMFGKNRNFACASAIKIFLWGDVLNLWNLIGFHPSKQAGNGRDLENIGMSGRTQTGTSGQEKKKAGSGS